VPAALSRGRHRGGVGVLRQGRWKPLPAAYIVALLAPSGGFAQGWPQQILQFWEKPQPVEWSYAGERGPEHWGDLSPDFSTCKTGTHQSPIDLGAARRVGYSPLSFQYRSNALSVINDGHLVRVVYLPGSYLRAGGREYELKEFRFHTPSEHRIDGMAADMEMQLVHEGLAGDLAVVSVLMRAGRRMNSTLSRIWDRIPPGPGQNYDREVGINPVFLLPSDRGYFTYVGSLTTPPCTEGVTWFVLAEPVEVDRSYVQRLLTLVGQNARALQALNGRAVYSVMHR
jgi:carbonic anhydrase